MTEEKGDFGIGLPCPQCGGKTQWKAVKIRSGYERGYFKCLQCGAKSTEHELSIIPDTTTIRINKSIRNALVALKQSKNDTYDDIIGRLLQIHQLWNDPFERWRFKKAEGGNPDV